MTSWAVKRLDEMFDRIRSGQPVTIMYDWSELRGQFEQVKSFNEDDIKTELDSSDYRELGEILIQFAEQMDYPED